jgi:hypothetical protein
MNARKRKLKRIEAEIEESFEDYIDLSRSLSPDLFKSLWRREWIFYQEVGIVPADLADPLSLLPDKAAARERIAQFEVWLDEWKTKKTQTEKTEIDLRFIGMIQRWLADNPRAASLWERSRRTDRG